MPDIDAEAAGILIGNGCDPLTAIAGAMIEEPQQPQRGRIRLVAVLGFVTGIVAVVLYKLASYS